MKNDNSFIPTNIFWDEKEQRYVRSIFIQEFEHFENYTDEQISNAIKVSNLIECLKSLINFNE